MNKAFKTLSAIAFASFACLFTACGETTTNVFSDENEEIADQEFGDEEEEDETVAASSSGTKQAKSSSSSKKKSSSSSDSDEDDENHKSSSSAKSKSSSSVVSSDSEESSSSSTKKDESKSSSSVKSERDSVATENPEVVKFTKKAVAGVCQKGPFVTGSTVTLYELDGETYARTGVTFAAKIASDNGEFEVSDVTLSSLYALLEVNGKYYNEVSGKKSSSAITLNALADLNDREKVNVNLLTHLEYKRALYLIGTGIELSAAKKQAEKEIFNAFGIQGDFANAEDLNIFGTGEGSAALLALSILVQGNLSESKLEEFLDKFAADIEKDGEWNDEVTKANVADWARRQDLRGKLSSIGSGISNLNQGKVPDFEKYVRNFWYTNYGLGTCGEENDGAVAVNSNELSAAYDGASQYICKNGTWMLASDTANDTTACVTGDVTDTMSCAYQSAEGAKRIAAMVEAALGSCTETRESDITLNTGMVEGLWYICKNREWVTTNRIVVDTQGWVEGVDGDIRKGDSTDAKYKYDETLGKWVDVDEYDAELSGCTVKRIGEIGWIGDREYYCSSYGWLDIMTEFWLVPKEVRLNPEIEYGEMTDARDGKKYKTVNIGKGALAQTWMAENLNYADSVNTPSLKGRSWCYYDGMGSYCDVAGRYYTWAAAIDSVALAKDVNNPQICGYDKACDRLTASVLAETPIQGICPDGWHLPSNAEWQLLFNAVDDPNRIGAALKSRSGWYDERNGNDAYGFSAIPAGYSFSYGLFGTSRLYASFWSSTQVSNNSKYAHRARLYYADVKDCNFDRDEGFVGMSVRCVKN